MNIILSVKMMYLDHIATEMLEVFRLWCTINENLSRET